VYSKNIDDFEVILFQIY